MANLVRVSEAASLGLHTMAILAKRRDRRWTNKDIAEALGASVHHLAKVMQRLVRAGLVDSTVGPQGGFQLGTAASRIKLMDIYVAVEGPLPEPSCLLGKPICEKAVVSSGHKKVGPPERARRLGWRTSTRETAIISRRSMAISVI